MFIVKVKLTNDEINAEYETTVDLLDEDIRDEDTLKQYVFDEAEFDNDSIDVDEFDISVEDPAECELQEAFDYVQWAFDSSQRDAEEIIKAAAYLDIKAEDIDECYEGYYRSNGEFARELADQMGTEIPDWVVVDWEATWDSSLRFDYSEADGHYFRSI